MPRPLTWSRNDRSIFTHRHCEEAVKPTKQSIPVYFLDCFVATKVAPRNDD
ncbi:hypothetical protein [Candidatus Tisiphia endosymbiont of Oplodontha viridula]|uniref:hypothetical protein n=1 Tax=Candidatus Tisiphia endosymbiont of Oplodontha viridula TaxID=3077925 RepID=UPI0035C8BE76